MKLAAPAAELEQLTPHNHQALSFGLPRDSAVPGQPLRPTRDSVEPQLGVGTPVAQRCRRSPLPPAAPRHRPALCLELSSVLKGRQGAPCPGRMGLPPVPLRATDKMGKGDASTKFIHLASLQCSWLWGWSPVGLCKTPCQLPQII